jgi:hypothetical protein
MLFGASGINFVLTDVTEHTGPILRGQESTNAGKKLPLLAA